MIELEADIIKEIFPARMDDCQEIRSQSGTNDFLETLPMDPVSLAILFSSISSTRHSVPIIEVDIYRL